MEEQQLGVAGALAPMAAVRVARPKSRSTNLTHEQKRLICLHARQFPKTTQAQLGQWAKEQFGLPYVPSQASVSYMLKKRQMFELMPGEGRDHKKLRTVKCPEVDVALANWFLYCQARQLKLPGDLVRHKARVLFEILAPHLSESVRSTPPQFSNGWMHSFMGRHGFSLAGGKGNKGGRGRAGSRDVMGADGRPRFSPDASVITLPDHIKTAVHGVAPENVYWLHETRLFYALNPDRDATPTGHHPDKKLTMLLCVNADGSDRLNPFFVGPHPLPGAANEVPEDRNFQFSCNRKAWLPPILLRDWLMALDWRMRVSNRHIVLLVDSAAALSVQKTSLLNVKMHFVERSHAGELCVRPLEVGIAASVKRRYRHQFLDFALDRREENAEDIYDVPLEKVVTWLAQGWQQLPRTRIMASFASTGVPVTSDSGGDIIPDNRVDDKLDAQIQALLKRLKLRSPMRLHEVVAPTAERACDEDLTDADFADSALHHTQGSAGMDVTAEEYSRGQPAAILAGNALQTTDTMEDDAVHFATHTASFHTPPRLASDYPGFYQGYPASADESWMAWSAAQRAATTATATTTNRAMNDVEAVKTVIRLAGEMNCNPAVVLELNRMQEELTSRANNTTAAGLEAPRQGPTQSAGVCRFTFGVPTRQLA